MIPLLHAKNHVNWGLCANAEINVDAADFPSKKQMQEIVDKSISTTGL